MSTPTLTEFRELGDLLFDVAEKLAERVRVLEGADFERRLKLLEETALRYEGTWQARSYAAGSAVTHQGGIWITRELTAARPGSPDPASRAWTLAVKAGYRPEKDRA